MKPNNESYGPSAIVNELQRLISIHGTYRAVAREIGVNHGVVWMALRPPMERYVSACLYDALGINKQNRTRFTADVTPEHLDRIDADIAAMGYKNRRDFFEAWGDGNIIVLDAYEWDRPR